MRADQSAVSTINRLYGVLSMMVGEVHHRVLVAMVD
jgi:hypothetical protein